MCLGQVVRVGTLAMFVCQAQAQMLRVSEDSGAAREQRRLELRQALLGQRQTEVPAGTAEPLGDPNLGARHLTPQELLELRRQLQELHRRRAQAAELMNR